MYGLDARLYVVLKEVGRTKLYIVGRCGSIFQEGLDLEVAVK